MALTLNTAQINAAAKDNQDLRETLTAINLSLQSLQGQTGASPLRKVDTRQVVFTGPPPASSLSIAGANGSFTVTITLPQTASGAAAPKNATNAAIFQELSSSPAADFSSSVTTYPVSAGTHYVFQNPGVTLFWRLRSSYNQQSWTSYTYSGAVSSGLQSSSATENNLSLNQSNFATIDSVGSGGVAAVRIYGSGGVGTAWSSVKGAASTVVPSGTILNIAYGSTPYIAWDGTQYQAKPALTQVFPDHWIPVGRVSVIANGAGLVLPTVTLLVQSGIPVGAEIMNAGNGMTAVPTLTVTDAHGSGCVLQGQITAGALTGVQIVNAGNGLYTSSPTVTASGGVASGGGGGGPAGDNGGRLYGQTS